MADMQNPYNEPNEVANNIDAGIEFTGKMLQDLNETVPWLRFIGILGFINCGIMAISSLISISDSGGAFIIVLVIAGISFIPAYFTFMFGTKIRNAFNANSMFDMEQAFMNNKSLWLFNGIMAIIALVCIIIGAVIIFSYIGRGGNLDYFLHELMYYINTI